MATGDRRSAAGHGADAAFTTRSPDAPRILFVVEGARSRGDVSALSAIAKAVEQAGAHVQVIRHGLGRLSTLQVARAARQAAPQLIVTTGLTSTRDLRRVAYRLGCPLVCYFWPSAPPVELHRRPSHDATRPPAPPSTGALLSMLPSRAVVGSQKQRVDLLHRLKDSHGRPLLSPHRVHLLPPLLDEAIFASSWFPSLTRSGKPAMPVAAGGLPSPVNVADSAVRTIALFGTSPSPLPAIPGLTYAHVDGAPVSQSADVSEAVRLSGCAGLLILVHDAADAREATRRILVALVLGRPVLLVGFADHSDDGQPIPIELSELPGGSSPLLRAASFAELPSVLPAWLGDLAPPPAAGAGVSVASDAGRDRAARSAEQDAALAALRRSLHPAQALSEHVALLFEALTEASPPRALTLRERAAALGGRLSRRPVAPVLRYGQVVAELRGFDLRSVVAIDTLERQLTTLLSAGYKPVSLATHALAAGATGPCFAVTFDGGHRGVADHAAPLLSRLGIPFTVFVATDLLDDATGGWPWPDLVVRSLRDPLARALTKWVWAEEPELRSLVEPGRVAVPWPHQARAVCDVLERMSSGRRQAIARALLSALRSILGPGPHLRASSVPLLVQAGADIGSHGCSLSPPATLDGGALAADLSRSRARIVELAGACSVFAPVGPYSADELRRFRGAAAEAGYTAVVAPGPHRSRRSLLRSATTDDRAIISRVSVGEMSSQGSTGRLDVGRFWQSLSDRP